MHKAVGQSSWIEWQEDVSTDEELVAWQERYEELSELANHPFNLNTITKEQLEQLPFLSDRMIENILYYVYKYKPVLTLNELLGVEGMDRQTRHFLKDFLYIGEAENERNKLRWKNLWKYNKQELLTRVDIPLNMKAGYADYPAEMLRKSPNKKYYGDPLYHNLRYRFRYSDKVMFGITAEKDAGEPFFRLHNRKGYDAYHAYLFLQHRGRLKKLAVGHYRASFGYGMVMNMNFMMGKAYSLSTVGRAGRGITPFTSVAEDNYLQGAAATLRISKQWEASAFYSFRNVDALVDDGFIRSLKTDGYHRLPKDMEKKNTATNHLAGMNIQYDGKYLEYGLTAVYNTFNRVLNPKPQPYNKYYPRGQAFYNAGAHYKIFMKRLILSGETAIDKQGAISALNTLSYSPTVNTSLLLINRYYDKRYQALYANAFGENSSVQNEVGCYVGIETNLLDDFKLLCYGDFFHFPYRRYRVDYNGTSGAEGVFQLSYSPHNSLSMLIKYSYKNRAQNFTTDEKKKVVLPYIRQRVQHQFRYSPFQHLSLKTIFEYVNTSYWQQLPSHGLLAGGILKASLPRFPLQITLNGTWFRTDNYDSRIYIYEPGLLYAFSMQSFYGRGMRTAVNLRYAFRKSLVIQAKWGWTHYSDRDRISSGTEEIQGSNKADVQLQVRWKW